MRKKHGLHTAWLFIYYELDYVEAAASQIPFIYVSVALIRLPHLTRF